MARLADLLSVEDARSRILEHIHRLDDENVDISAALGRVLAEDVVAAVDVPPFANSSMDGFAVRSVDTAGASMDHPVELRVAGFIAAGSGDQIEVQPGSSARIMTGAPLPHGADSVVPFENVDDHGDAIVLRTPVAASACVRPAGGDARRGGAVATSGTQLGPWQIAALVATGARRLTVVRRPVVALLATGDELVPAGQPLRRGQIYNSNVPMLSAALVLAGAEVRLLETTGDDPEKLRMSMQGAQGCDLLVTTGGASVGDYDYVKDVIGESGEVGFWRVRMRPGKPLIFGRFGRTPFIGLPGNPTSAAVTFEQFVRPAVRTMLGAPALRPRIRVVAEERIDNHGGRRTYARVRFRERDGRVYVRLSGPQDSAMLLPLAAADGLLEIPEDISELHPGDEAIAEVWELNFER